jgi:beta-mannosidase
MKIDFNDSQWQVRKPGNEQAIPALVPGCIHKDLLRAGLIPDPQVRDNEKLVQWVGETDWTYEREFELPTCVLDHEHVELVCDGLDTLATILINGKELVRTDNMHRRYRFEVRRFLRPGTNRIEITFASPVKAIRKLQEVRSMPHWLADCMTPGFSWLRKAHCNFGWDITQKLPTCGIWRPIQIEAWNQSRLGDVRVDQKHSDESVTLTVYPEIMGQKGFAFRATLNFQGQDLCTATSPGPINLNLRNPQLWWPSGMGGQPLYNLRVELLADDNSVLDMRDIRIGLRTLQLRREKDQWGESFAFEVNGRVFFAKGASWIPTDVYGGRRDPAYYRTLLASAVDANMNMIRVWGGGVYEEDLFYKLCDELGLCVWQDFMFACAAYPLDDEAFVENIRLEAVDNVRRLQHHACLALWCGNNELELGWNKGWGLIGDDWQYGPFGKMPLALYVKLFDVMLPEIVREHGGLDYWPGTPHSPTGDRKDSNNPDCGDAHIWNVLMECQPFSFYTKCDHRFISEFGFQSLPAPGLLRNTMNEEDCQATSQVMDRRQRMPVGNGGIMCQWVRHLPLPGDFDAFAWGSQILHSILLETAIAHWRRNTPRTMGVLNWMINDQWPGMTNATIDSTGAWKAPHYSLRRLFAPLLVSGVVSKDKNCLEIHVSSDKQVASDVTVEWIVMLTDSKVLGRGRKEANVPSLSSQVVYNLDIREYRKSADDADLLFWLELKIGGAFVSDAVVSLVPPKHLNLRDSQLRIDTTATSGCTSCRITVERPALWVWADAPVGQSWSDNFFHLRPGVEKEVRLPMQTDAVWHSLGDLEAMKQNR